MGGTRITHYYSILSEDTRSIGEANYICTYKCMSTHCLIIRCYSIILVVFGKSILGKAVIVIRYENYICSLQVRDLISGLSDDEIARCFLTLRFDEIIFVETLVSLSTVGKESAI